MESVRKTLEDLHKPLLFNPLRHGCNIFTNVTLFLKMNSTMQDKALYSLLYSVQSCPFIIHKNEVNINIP